MEDLEYPISKYEDNKKNLKFNEKKKKGNSPSL